MAARSLYRHTQLAVTLLTIGALLAGSAAAGSASGPANFHYRYFKDSLPLSLEVERIAVYEEGQESRDGFGQDFALFGLSNADLKNHSWKDWATLSVPAHQQNENAVLGLVANLAANADVDFVSPIFRNELGPVIVTRDLLIGFHEKTPVERRRQIVQELAPGAILDEDFAGNPGLFRVRTETRDGLVVLELANLLADLDEVEFAEPDFIFTGKTDLTPTDPEYPNLWGLNNTGQAGGTVDQDMDAPEAWDISTGSSSVTVTVLDLGIQFDHPDLNLLFGADFTGRGTGGQPFTACDNHGTVISSCIVGRINNGIGVVGIAPNCRVRSAKIGESADCAGPDFSGSATALTSAIGWARSNGSRVTNSSFRFGNSSSVASAYQNTRNQGLVHFASSGNDGASTLPFPAQLTQVQAVGAVDRNGLRASFSTTGTGLDLVAPGVAIVCTDRTGAAGDAPGDYTTTQGTSLSCPYAAGVAALVRSVNPALTPAQVEATLQNTAVDRGAAGYDTTFGFGFVNARAALISAGGLTIPGPFNLVSPNDGLTGQPLAQTFSWSAASGATSYTLVIDDEPDFLVPEVTITGITTTSRTLGLTALETNRLYYWRVLALNPAGEREAGPGLRSYTTLIDCDEDGIHDPTAIATSAVPDCNENGIPDDCDLVGLYRSPTRDYSPLEVGTTHQFIIPAVQAATGSVSFSGRGNGDISDAIESVEIRVNGVSVGALFDSAGLQDCLPAGSADIHSISAATFNAAITPGQNAVIDLVPSVFISATQCAPPTWISLQVSYLTAARSLDADMDGIPDECETVILVGDLNCDGVVNFDDISPFVVALVGQAAYEAQYPTCFFVAADANQDGVVNFGDIDGFITLLIG